MNMNNVDYVKFKLDDECEVHIGKRVIRLGNWRLDSVCGEVKNRSTRLETDEPVSCKACLRVYKEDG